MRTSNETIIEQFSLASVEVVKGSSTGAEVLALKKVIQGQQTQLEKMREAIKHNKATNAFLVDYLVLLPQEVRHGSWFTDWKFAIA